MANTSCLTELPRLTEEEVLRVLTERLLADTIYTSVNAMLIAVNPCMLIDKLYGVEQMQKYSGCLLYTSPSPRDLSTSRMPSSA